MCSRAVGMVGQYIVAVVLPAFLVGHSRGTAMGQSSRGGGLWHCAGGGGDPSSAPAVAAAWLAVQCCAAQLESHMFESCTVAVHFLYSVCLVEACHHWKGFSRHPCFVFSVRHCCRASGLGLLCHPTSTAAAAVLDWRCGLVVVVHAVHLCICRRDCWQLFWGQCSGYGFNCKLYAC
jgi:hypothetical protein